MEPRVIPIEGKDAIDLDQCWYYRGFRINLWKYDLYCIHPWPEYISPWVKDNYTSFHFSADKHQVIDSNGELVDIECISGRITLVEVTQVINSIWLPSEQWLKGDFNPTPLSPIDSSYTS